MSTTTIVYEAIKDGRFSEAVHLLTSELGVSGSETFHFHAAESDMLSWYVSPVLCVTSFAFSGDGDRSDIPQLKVLDVVAHIA